MSDVTKITFDDNGGKGTLTMHRNPFKNGRKYYARFDRDTITMEQVIARIQKRELGTNALMVQHITGLIKAEILEALSRGEAVNVLDLGTLFITADAFAENGNADDLTVAGFSAAFTPSALTNGTLKSLSVRKVTIADNSPCIEQLFDTYTEEACDEFPAGTRVRVAGSHLKLGGETHGLYLCPLDEGGGIPDDESQWIPIEESLLKVNLARKIEFIIPREQAAGSYRILLRTSYAGGAKSLKTVHAVQSGIIRVTEA